MSEAVTTYRVLYKGKPGHEDIKKGIHAKTCVNMDEANQAVESCKKWFNTIVVRAPETSSDGKVLKSPAVIETKDRVHVWINTLQDGNTLVDREKECETSESTGSSSTSSAEPSVDPVQQPTKKSEKPEKKTQHAAVA